MIVLLLLWGLYGSGQSRSSYICAASDFFAFSLSESTLNFIRRLPYEISMMSPRLYIIRCFRDSAVYRHVRAVTGIVCNGAPFYYP